ncbi:hypothetical protein SCA6_014826 [Theobroma cacao]
MYKDKKGGHIAKREILGQRKTKKGGMGNPSKPISTYGRKVLALAAFYSSSRQCSPRKTFVFPEIIYG